MLNTDSSRAAMNLARMLRPRTAAVVGASRDPKKIGARIAASILSGGFTGELFLINPTVSEIRGRGVRPSLRSLGHTVDLVFAAVPSGAVRAVVEEAVQIGAGGIVVVTAGFAETGAAGAAEEARIAEIARVGGVRLIGPNCFGLINRDPAVSLNGTFGDISGGRARVAFASQSGAMGIVFLDRVRTLGLGVEQFVSLGNCADVSSVDLLELWGSDPNIDVIALYLESFTNPRRFIDAAAIVSRRKPIVLLKGGRSSVGARAASSHTAALLTSAGAAAALAARAGVVPVDSLEDLLGAVRLLASGPPPGGPRVGVVTNSGGPAILFADHGEPRGLTFPLPSDETVHALRKILPPNAGVRNPIDVTAGAQPHQFVAALEHLAPEVDILAALTVPIGLIPMPDLHREIAGAFERAGRGRRCIVIDPTPEAPNTLAVGELGVMPVYHDSEAAARAVAAGVRAGRIWKTPAPAPVAIDPGVRRAVRGALERVGRRSPSGWLRWDECVLILDAVGIRSIEGEIIAANRMEPRIDSLVYPLVLKIGSPAVIHKSDVGGVCTDIRTPSELRAAIAAMRRSLEKRGIPLEDLLVQRFESGGCRFFVGLAHDAAIGPVVACGLGGTAVEVVGDVSFGIPPLNRQSASELVDHLRSRALLGEWRGAPKSDRESLEEIIERVGILAEAAPEIVELDLNPVAVLPHGQGAIVLDARIRIGGAEHGAS